jgi:hypothetical protein
MSDLNAHPPPPGRPEITASSFYNSLDQFFTTFDVKITEHSEVAYRAAFECAEAKSRKNVVYLFRSDREVRRLVGASDILYIGQTKHSFRDRYERWAAKHATIKRNNHVLDAYGSIRLSTCDYRLLGDSLLAAENQLLWWYYQNHFEYPPFNYTRAKDPRNVRSPIIPPVTS